MKNKFLVFIKRPVHKRWPPAKAVHLGPIGLTSSILKYLTFDDAKTFLPFDICVIYLWIITLIFMPFPIRLRYIATIAQT